MLELAALWFIGRRMVAIADQKRRDRGWAAVLVMFWFLGELMGYLAARQLGLGVIAAYVTALIVAAAWGAGVFAWLWSLPPLPPFDPRMYDKLWTYDACPQCGSEQTYVCAIKVRCFRCDYLGKPGRGSVDSDRRRTRRRAPA